MGEPFQYLGVPHCVPMGGWLSLIGSGTGVVPPHAHHAIQIVITMHGRVAVCGSDGVWRDGPGLVVRPDVVHSFNPQGARAAMFFVDPESTGRAWLQSSLAEDITIVPEAPLAAPRPPCARSRNGRSKAWRWAPSSGTACSR